MQTRNVLLPLAILYLIYLEFKTKKKTEKTTSYAYKTNSTKTTISFNIYTTSMQNYYYIKSNNRKPIIFSQYIIK